MGKIRFKAWDLGGHEAARKTWRNYVSDVDGNKMTIICIKSFFLEIVIC